MKKSMSLAIALLATALAASQASAQARPAGTAEDPPPPAPPAGSPGIFRSNADLQAVLARSIAEGGARASARITTTDQYRASLVRRTEPNGAITHPGNTEVHYIIEGSGTVVTGGTVIRHEGAPATIEGGEAHRVVPGDIVFIPDGSAHMYSEVVEPIMYLEVRFVVPK